MVASRCNASAGEMAAGGVRGLTGHPATLLGEIQVSKRPCLKEQRGTEIKGVQE